MNEQDRKDRADFLRGHMDAMRETYVYPDTLLATQEALGRVREMYLADCAEWSGLLEAEKKNISKPSPNSAGYFSISDKMQTKPPGY